MGSPMTSRKRLVRWSVAGVVLVALGVVAVEGEWIPGPKPSFPEGSGVRVYVSEDSLPPEYESGVSVTAYAIKRDSAHFIAGPENGGGDSRTLRVGETADFAGVTITLCDTW